MALFDELQEPLSIHQYAAPEGWTEGGYTFIADITGYIEPVVASASLINQQDMQGISHVAFLPIAYKGVVKPNMYVIDADGTQYQNKGMPENWKFIIPYVMLKLVQPQTLLVIPVPST